MNLFLLFIKRSSPESLRAKKAVLRGRDHRVHSLLYKNHGNYIFKETIAKDAAKSKGSDTMGKTRGHSILEPLQGYRPF